MLFWCSLFLCDRATNTYTLLFVRLAFWDTFGFEYGTNTWCILVIVGFCPPPIIPLNK